MEPDPTMAMLVALHRGLERLGPGSEGSTLRALALCEGLPAAPAVLDLGCGAGAATLVLARALGPGATVTAVDLFPVFLDELGARAAAAGLDRRVRTVAADMAALPFADGAFDLVWSEGAVYHLGFDAGLAGWRRLLRPGGWLAVTELSWIAADPPAEARGWWAAEYPAMRSVEENLAAAQALGFQVGGHFVLPSQAWTRGYYGPLAARLEPLLAAHPGDPAAAAVVEATRREMALYAAHGGHYGYGFYVLRWPG